MNERGRPRREAGDAIVPELREGLSAIAFPSLTNPRTIYEGTGIEETVHDPVTKDEALGRINSFLDALSAQGAELKHVMEIPILNDEDPYIETHDVLKPPVEPNKESMHIAIVEKPRGEYEL